METEWWEEVRRRVIYSVEGEESDDEVGFRG